MSEAAGHWSIWPQWQSMWPPNSVIIQQHLF